MANKMIKKKKGIFEKRNNNRVKDPIGDRIVQVIIYIIAAIAAFVTVAPFLYVLAGSFATERELVERAFFIFPTEISFNAYKYIIQSGRIFTGLKNSFIVTILGTAINMIFTTTFAYPLSKKDFKGRNFVLNMVIITMLFSGGMIPNFLLLKSLGMYNTFWALTVPGAISAFNLIIIKNFFENIPSELEEAARIDGCSDIKTFTTIVLPLSKPVLASIGLFYAVGHWNNYFDAMLYLQDNAKFTAQIILRQIVLLAQGITATGEIIDYGTAGAPPDQAVKMATIMVATLPILMVYPFVQKYFTQGVMVGAVKG